MPQTFMYINKSEKVVWNIASPDPNAVRLLAENLKISDFLAKLLVSKGITDTAGAEDFLYGDYHLLHDPFLLPDMDKAVERVNRALDNGEKILIYGDYDVDGVTSVSLLLLYLRSRGADAEYYIPERVNEGYGLNKNAIDRFSEQGVTLVVTVDSGITASEEIVYAAEHGIDVVVTDHHECREQLPGAVAVVNPHRADSAYPFKELAGVGVVFKLVCALEGNKNINRLCSKYSDIVALGTVADVMPIIGENRVIVKAGLDRLNNTSNEGLKALSFCTFSEKRSSKNKKFTASSISFGLAPRINAAGRIGDVNQAVKLLITENKQEAVNIADYLCSVNRERQLIENLIFEQAVEQIEKSADLQNDKVIVLTSDSWHLGVIGIVASKITDKYGLPSILISFDSDNIGKGSGRSVKGFNINEAISNCRDCLIKYGGHELAAGLTISRDKVEEFRKRINEYAVQNFDFDGTCTYLDADFEISGKDVSIENVAEIMKLEPYGLSNPEPLFYMSDVKIRELYSIGEGKHLKLVLEKDGNYITAVYFGMSKENFPFTEGMSADFMFNLGCNNFRGYLTVQMYVQSVRPENKAYTEKLRQQLLFGNILSGKAVCPKIHIPELMDFRVIFMFLKNAVKNYSVKYEFSVYRLAAQVSAAYNTAVSPCKLNIALEVFKEMKLIELYRTEDPDIVDIELIKTEAKVDLNKSEFLHSVKTKKVDGGD